MILNKRFRMFLLDEKASTRLFSMLNHALLREGDKDPTLSQFIDEWPLDRLKTNCFGFGKKAQAELLEIFERHCSCRTGMRFADYCASLSEPDCSPDNLRKMSLLRLFQQLVEVTEKTQSTRIRNIIEELKKREVEPPFGPSASWVNLVKSPIQTDRTCIYCGCTDSKACRGGCSWVITFQFGNVGVCSSCIAPHAPFKAAIEPLIKKKK